MAEVPTGRVTFFFTDIQGSTAMWERDARRMQTALVRHDEIMKSTVESYGGFVFKMVGDACCAAFASAPDALQAAITAQRAIFKEPWDDRVRVRVRMALHTGEAEERGGDYFGPPLNRVARLLSAGHGGQTLISRATHELAGEDLPEGVSLRDMGEHRLRDLKEPERIFQLLAPDLPSEFPPLKTLEAPSEDDRYRLIRQIGSGGMAEVYLAYDEVLEREVAFKVLDRKHAQNKEAIERFRREARSAASLSHDPNIVAIHDRGETQDGTYYIVMEYMEGGTLEDLIEREGPLPPSRAAEITLQVAKALSVAHEKGVIHRDIKPQNILLSKTGAAKVADFGIARAASATTMTQAGSVMGTVHYISPEQALGEAATPKSDLYSLGVTLYEMLTGELPFDAETPAGVVMKHVGGLSRSPKEANPEVPEELDAVTTRLLRKDPEDRYPDASSLVKDLERAKEGLPLDAATRERHGAKKIDHRFQRRGVLAALALVVISVGVIGAVALTQGGLFAGQSRNLPQMSVEQVTSEPLTSGRYATDEFEPEFSFTTEEGEGWRLSYPDTPDYFELTTSKSVREYYPSLGFIHLKSVFAPNGQDQIELGSDARITSAPGDVVTWLRNHPNLDVSKPTPVTVGSVSGTSLDVEVSPAPEDHETSEGCGPRSCVFLFAFTEARDGTGVALWEDDTNRLIVLQGVEGETVIIAINIPPNVEGFLPKAQEVLDTVEWQDAP